MAAFQVENEAPLNMHFYASYHGHNVCDGHASHMKLSIQRKLREIGVEKYNENIFIESISKIKNTHVYFLPPNSIERGVPISNIQTFLESKLDGIRSFHHFSVSHERKKEAKSFVFRCYKLSSDEQPIKEIPIEELMKYNREKFLQKRD